MAESHNYYELPEIIGVLIRTDNKKLFALCITIIDTNNVFHLMKAAVENP